MKVPSRLYPPHYLVLSIASIVGINWLVPVPFVAAAFALIGGLLFLVIGLILAASAARLFSKAKTGIVPFSESTKLVISGAYRLTRNPMYLGMALVLASIAVFFNLLGGIILIALFCAYITKFQIIPEERAMSDLFSDDFDKYTKETRRWI